MLEYSSVLVWIDSQSISIHLNYRNIIIWELSQNNTENLYITGMLAPFVLSKSLHEHINKFGTSAWIYFALILWALSDDAS